MLPLPPLLPLLLRLLQTLGQGQALSWALSTSMFAHPTTNSINIVGKVRQAGCLMCVPGA